MSQVKAEAPVQTSPSPKHSAHGRRFSTPHSSRFKTHGSEPSDTSTTIGELQEQGSRRGSNNISERTRSSGEQGSRRGSKSISDRSQSCGMQENIAMEDMLRATESPAGAIIRKSQLDVADLTFALVQTARAQDFMQYAESKGRAKSKTDLDKELATLYTQAEQDTIMRMHQAAGNWLENGKTDLDKELERVYAEAGKEQRKSPKASMRWTRGGAARVHGGLAAEFATCMEQGMDLEHENNGFKSSIGCAEIRARRSSHLGSFPEVPVPPNSPPAERPRRASLSSISELRQCIC